MSKARSNLASVIGSVVVMGALASATTARAQEVDYVSVAIDALQAGGAAVGVFITEDEKRFLKPLVQCLADKGADVTVRDCGKQMITGQLPPEAEYFASCVVDKADVPGCALDAAIDKLPDKAEQPARCLLGGARIETCAGDALLNELPPKEQEALRCLERTRNAPACGINYARSAAEDNFANAWGKVHGDVGQIGAKAEGPIKNLVDVAVGIRDDDWVKVATSGGAAATKVAGRIVLKIFLGGVGDILFGPAVDAAVDNRIGMVSGIMRAVKLKDPGAVAEVLVASNLGYAVFVTCSVMRSDVPITGTIIAKGVCDALGGIIMLASDVAGSLVNKIADLIHFDAIAKEIESVLHDVRLSAMILTGEKSGRCKPVKEAYKEIYAKCYSKQAFLNLTNAPNSKTFPDALERSCRDHYLECSFANDQVLDKTCGSLTEQYLIDTAILTASIAPEGEAGVNAKVPNRRCTKFDDAERTGLEIECRKHLEAVFPPTGSIDTASCGPSQTPTFGGQAYGLYEPVCREAVNKVEASRLENCKESLKVTKCTGGRIPGFGGVGCMCPEYLLWDDKAEQCVSKLAAALGDPCQGGMVQDPTTRKCKCPDRQLWDGTRCKLDKSIVVLGGGGPALPGVGGPCSGGMRIGSNGKCECPPATYWSGDRCKASSPSIKGDDKDKFVFNSGGSYTNTGTEIIRKCGGRRPNGSWPNCCPQRTYYSNGMCRYVHHTKGGDGGASPTRAGTKKACIGAECCPAGTLYRAGICRRVIADPGHTKTNPASRAPDASGGKVTTPVCPASRPVGRPPYCCPAGTRYTMGACRRGLAVLPGKGVSGGACPASRPVGRPPNCCPSGTSYSNGACRRPALTSPTKRQHYGGAAPACKSYEKRGSDGKCYYDSQGLR